jgi:hypothetical protein
VALCWAAWTNSGKRRQCEPTLHLSYKCRLWPATSVWQRCLPASASRTTPTTPALLDPRCWPARPTSRGSAWRTSTTCRRRSQRTDWTMRCCLTGCCACCVSIACCSGGHVNGVVCSAEQQRVSPVVCWCGMSDASMSGTILGVCCCRQSSCLLSCCRRIARDRARMQSGGRASGARTPTRLRKCRDRSSGVPFLRPA